MCSWPPSCLPSPSSDTGSVGYLYALHPCMVVDRLYMLTLNKQLTTSNVKQKHKACAYITATATVGNARQCLKKCKLHTRG